MNKVVIITGASSGIGMACAKEFSDAGYHVVMAARNIDKLKEIEAELKQTNQNVVSVQTDVSLEGDCENLINKSLETFGKIDILINNAGISMRALFIELDLSVLKTLMNTNFWGMVYCTKYALPHILKQKGSIVGLSSIAGFMGLPARIGYTASKFAIHGFLETLRIEFMNQGLHVMIVAPWFTASNIRRNALGPDGAKQNESPRDESRLMTSAVVAEKIKNGVQRRKRLIILTKKGKFAVFLKRIVPKLMDYLNFYVMKREPNSPLK